MRKWSMSLLNLALLLVTATVLVAAGADHEHQIKVGKKSQITFEHKTMVGSMVLEPGVYQIQHRVDGEDHFVHFHAYTSGLPTATIYPQPKEDAGNAKCRIERLPEKVKATSVYTNTSGDVVRVTKVLVAGENVAHLF